MNDVLKKILIIIIASALVIGVCSCGSGGTDTEATENDEAMDPVGFLPYKYGIVPGDYIFSVDSGSLLKYNVYDGKTSHLCPDPFCNHENENCQFTGLLSRSFASIGNTVYYIRQDKITGKGTLFSFDADTAETKTVYACQGKLTNVYSYEYRLLLRVTESSDSSANSYYFWYDTKTDKTDELDARCIPGNSYIEEIRNDRIIWSTLNSDEYYSTDLNGGDYKEHDYGYAYGNYYTLEPENAEDGRTVYSLYAAINNKNEKKLILKDVGPCIFYENKIVYFKSLPYNERKTVHIDENGRSIKSPYGGDVYVVNPDGTDNHLLLHTEEYLIGMTSDSLHPQICGDYFGIIAGHFEEGDNLLEDKLIIANINTGEFVVTHD